MSTSELIRRVTRVAGLRPAIPRRFSAVLLVAAVAVAATAVGGASALTTPPSRSSEPAHDAVQDIVEVGLGRSVPVRIMIPSIDVDAEVVPLGLDGGELAAPPDATRAGWYERGTSPGELGSAVIVGHAVPERLPGPAVFAQLDRVTPGDRIRVVREDGAVASFTVDRVKDFILDDRHRETGAEAQLRLVSTDRTDPQQADELVVWATLAP
jgi:hypothetical protein